LLAVYALIAFGLVYTLYIIGLWKYGILKCHPSLYYNSESPVNFENKSPTLPGSTKNYMILRKLKKYILLNLHLSIRKIPPIVAPKIEPKLISFCAYYMFLLRFFINNIEFLIIMLFYI